MRIAVDISLYPLDADYVPTIKDFIERLNRRSGLRVRDHAMSTQVAGEHDLGLRRAGRGTKAHFRRPMRAGVRVQGARRRWAVAAGPDDAGYGTRGPWSPALAAIPPPSGWR